MNEEEFRLKVFLPIVISLHEMVVTVIKGEEDNIQEIKSLSTAPFIAEIKSKLQIELMLLQTLNDELGTMLKGHKNMKKTIEEYLKLRGWQP